MATSFFLTADWSSLHRKKYRQASSGLLYLKSQQGMTEYKFFLSLAEKSQGRDSMGVTISYLISSDQGILTGLTWYSEWSNLE